MIYNLYKYNLYKSWKIKGFPTRKSGKLKGFPTTRKNGISTVLFPTEGEARVANITEAEVLMKGYHISELVLPTW